MLKNELPFKDNNLMIIQTDLVFAQINTKRSLLVAIAVKCKIRHSIEECVLIGEVESF